MKKKYYRDFYGGTATIGHARGGGFRLRMAAKYGPVHTDKVYNTFRGAKMAMSRSSDGWLETADVEQVCNACGSRFTLRYYSDGTCSPIGAPCDCDVGFHPVEGKPSFTEWLALLDN